MALRKKPECETCQRSYDINHDVYQPLARILGLLELISMEMDQGNYENIQKYRDLIKPEYDELRKRVNILFFIDRLKL